MKQSTKDFLIYISNYCSMELTRYKYSKALKESEKYKKGKLAAIDFMQELTYHFLLQEHSLQKQFIIALENQIDEVSVINDGEYKKGITDAISE